MMRTALRTPVLVVAMLAPAPTLSAQQPCTVQVASTIDAGWTAYRAQRFSAADSLFSSVVAVCPDHADARVGMAYARLQRGALDTALVEFRGLLERFPEHVDALTGAGLALWRQGELADALRMFRAVIQVDPDNQLAMTYLNRVGDVGQLMPRPPDSPSDTLVMWSRTHGRHFDVLDGTDWTPFYLAGVNLGAALPGRHPSEFPDSLQYVEWIEDIGTTGFNFIRVYTHHPPHFYKVLRDYNLRHPDRPVWLVHGAWTELPHEGQFDDETWREHFYNEMRRTVDIIHGRADRGLAEDLREPFYTADVSRWTLGYIIGREWESSALFKYHALVPDRTSMSGTYFNVTDGSPTEVLMAETMEVMVQYETEVYGHQRPIAFTSWPTLDPLQHSSEATYEEQLAIRAAAGHYVPTPTEKADNEDEIHVNPERVVATDRMRAGTFAVFHIYPYYPDFMINDPALQGVESPDGTSNYYAYLQRMRDAMPDIPLVVGEYGVPASTINAHLQPQGWHHGGHTESAMAEIDARLTREIAAAGFAGGAVFAWIDEWFKRNWLVYDFEVPGERNRIWWNRLDAEQHYGMIATEPEPRLGEGRLRDRRVAWETVEPLYLDRWGTIRVTHDEAYLHLLFESASDELPDELFFGFDIVDPARGDVRWPGNTHDIPVGVEFVMKATPTSVVIMADSSSNPLDVIELPWTLGDSVPLISHDMERVSPPGYFEGRYRQGYPDSVVSVANADGRYEPLRVVSNDLRIGRDGVEYTGMGYDRGILRGGPQPDGQWERDGNALEVRIPWMLLNFTDPSQRRVLQGAVGRAAGEFETVQIESIGIVATARDGSDWLQWPVVGGPDDVARYTWPHWDVTDIQWRPRRRPVADRMQETIRRLRPAVTEEHRN